MIRTAISAKDRHGWRNHSVIGDRARSVVSEKGLASTVALVRYHWSKTDSHMVLYQEDSAPVFPIAASIGVAEPRQPGINYVAEGPLVGERTGYRTLHEAMEAVEEAVRQTGASVKTSYRDFRYQPL